MYKRVVVIASLVLFGLVALVATIVTDLHDRSFPQVLGARSAVTLDFSGASMSDAEAFDNLSRLSDDLGLALFKVAPDLAGDHSGQAYVTLDPTADFPESFARFGNQRDAQIKDASALEHSFATGEYLVTGEHADLTAMRGWLEDHHITAKWADDSVGATMTLVVREASFLTSLLAAVALTISLVLFWLSVRARGRALRVLAGIPAWRIQAEDLGGFFLAVITAALVCDAVAVTIVGVTQGWVFVPYYAQALAIFGGVIVAATMVGAFIMSSASWPTVEMLALRQPAVKSLRQASTFLKTAVFVLVLAAVQPAASAYARSTEAAAQQATWNSLADQVVVTFPSALGESGFQGVTQAVGEVVRSAETDDAVALSYTWTSEPSQGLDFGNDKHVSLVNQKWLDLMLGTTGGSDPDTPGFTPLTADELPAEVRGFLTENIELWTREPMPASQILDQFSFYRYSGAEEIPMAIAGGGDLTFLDSTIMIVAPRLYDVFNDDFLSSLASSQNLVFTGLAPTLKLLKDQGLDHSLYVKHVAETGVLRAQYTAYFAWLQGVSLVALIVALAVAAVIGALITAMLKARRDFPLRLSGQRWTEVLAGRILSEWAPGLAIMTLVLLLQSGSHALLVALVATAALVLSPVTHLVAARWSFTNLSLRRL